MNKIIGLWLIVCLAALTACKDKKGHGSGSQTPKIVQTKPDPPSNSGATSTTPLTLIDQIRTYHTALEGGRLEDAVVLAQTLSQSDFAGTPLGQGDIWNLKTEFSETLYRGGKSEAAIELLDSVAKQGLQELGEFYQPGLDEETRKVRSPLFLETADRLFSLANWQYDTADFANAYENFGKVDLMRSRVYGFGESFPDVGLIYERRFLSAKNEQMSFDVYCDLIVELIGVPYQERPYQIEELEYWGETAVDCPPMGGASTELPSEPEFEKLTVFYGTSREATRRRHPEKSYNAERAGLSVGSIEMTIPLKREIGTIQVPGILDFWGAQDGVHIVLKKIDKDSNFATFQSRLANHVSENKSKDREAFIYVHGHSVSFANAARRTAQLAVDLDMRYGGLFYSWPAGENVARYFKSQANVDHAATELQSFLNLVTQVDEIDTLHVIAHSMGNDVLSKALTNMQIQGYVNQKRPFGQVVWASPDVDAKEFSTRIQSLKQRNIADGMTLYASGKDKALSVSQWIWDNLPRAGQAPPLSEIAQIIETVDTTQIDRKASDLIAHGDFASSAIDDLRAVIWLSLMPSRRCELTQKEVDGITYWSSSPAESDCDKPLFREAVEIARMKLQPLESRTVDPGYFKNQFVFVPMMDEDGNEIPPPLTPAEILAEDMLTLRAGQ